MGMLAFVFGLFIGAIIGMVLTALVSVNGRDD